MMTTKWSAAALVLLLGACSLHEDNQQAAAAITPTADATGVAREAVEASPTPVAAPLPAAIQTQPGPNGATVALNRVAVTGDILTVAMTYSNASCCNYPALEEVSVIDDATAQRISVLKDNAGKWMAAPMDSDGKRLRIGFSNGPNQVWFKFPAPPPTSKTVSITVPEVAPFDAVPVTR